MAFPTPRSYLLLRRNGAEARFYPCSVVSNFHSRAAYRVLQCAEPSYIIVAFVEQHPGWLVSICTDSAGSSPQESCHFSTEGFLYKFAMLDFITLCSLFASELGLREDNLF